jgi:hypothetical protein
MLDKYRALYYCLNIENKNRGNKMSARGHHARRTDPDISKFFITGKDHLGIFLKNKDYFQPKSKLYYMMKKIESGKITLPIPNKYFNIKGYFGFDVTNDNKLEFLYII